MPRKAAKGKAAPPVEEAQFIFRGTVLQVGGSLLAEVPVSDSTVVVRVEEILHGPEVLQGQEGQSLTVQLGGGQKVEEGQEYIFHTNGWIYGDSLAVTSVGIEPAGAEHVETARAAAMARPAAQLRARAARADAVVSGRVTHITPVPPEPGAPVSEHDPEWHDARVHVDEAVKGGKRKASAGKEVVVRFAASRDARWAHAPKLSVGSEGVFMLGDTAPARKALRAFAQVPADHYMVVDPDDFHPAERAAEVLSLIK